MINGKGALQPRSVNPDEVRRVVVMFAVASGVGVLCSLVPALRLGTGPLERITPLALSLAALAIGAVVGFLFGVPKLAPEELPVQGGSRPLLNPNTNLEQISDWLTKIIVGLGLVNLKQIPDALNGLGHTIAGSSPMTLGNPVLSLGLAIYMAVVGFGFAYLLAQLWLPFFLKRVLLEIRGREIAKQRVETELALEAQKNLAIQQSVAPKVESAAREAKSDGNGNGEGLPTGLLDLADEYLGVSIADEKERLATKDRLSVEMGMLVEAFSVDRGLLASSGHEGLWIALVTAVFNKPRTGDFELLRQIAPRLTRLHVKYRFVVALLELARQGLLSPGQAAEAVVLIEGLREGADRPVLEIIERATTVLRAVR